MLGPKPELAPLARLVQLNIDVQTVAAPRANRFNAKLHSDNLIMEVVTWVAGSGALGTSAKMLKDILIAYLHSRNTSIEVSVGKKKIKMSGPLSRDQVERLLSEVAPVGD